ncbi:mucin-2-like isoform X2 [Sycon ciliatum]|uniref:mucin-2-like isoform X2 n=1 Tax=Sycon ciliatum TaxID=27933 RepID=UPI0031F6F9E5
MTPQTGKSTKIVNYMLEVRWQDCNSTGCLEPHRLSAPPSCQDGYTMIGTVETHCPQCDKTWRCPDCLPFDNHLCFSFGHRVTDGNRTCTVFNVPRLYKVRRCLACSSSCQQCDGTSSSSCISCKSGKVLVSGKCLEPWIFIVLAAACGIVICIIISVVIITANIRKRTGRKRIISSSSSAGSHCSQHQHNENYHQTTTLSERTSTSSTSGNRRHNQKNSVMASVHGNVDTDIPSYYSPLIGGAATTTGAPWSAAPSHYQGLHAVQVQSAAALASSSSAVPTAAREDVDFSNTRLQQRPSVYESLQRHPSVYEPLRPQLSQETYQTSSPALQTVQDQTPPPPQSFEERLATSHYTPLQPALQPDLDATYAHPTPSPAATAAAAAHGRPRAKSMYTALAGDANTVVYQATPASRQPSAPLNAPLNTPLNPPLSTAAGAEGTGAEGTGRYSSNYDRFATAPSRGKLQARRKLPVFSRWSCLAPASAGTPYAARRQSAAASTSLHREASWRFRAGTSDSDPAASKPDLWISSVTIGGDKPTPAVSSTRVVGTGADSHGNGQADIASVARPISLHTAASKQVSDPTARQAASFSRYRSEEGTSVHRASSFSHSSSTHSQLSQQDPTTTTTTTTTTTNTGHHNLALPLTTGNKKTGTATVAVAATAVSRSSRRRTSPLVSPLHVRKRQDKSSKAPGKNSNSNSASKSGKKQTLPRWSMIPTRTLRLAEKKRQQDAWQNTGASGYEDPMFVSRTDTLTHYYHVLEKRAEQCEDTDERWQYGSNPSLATHRQSERLRKAMSLAPSGATTRSLSRDDLLFVHSLVKECGLEGDHDIVVDTRDNSGTDDVATDDVTDDVTTDDVNDHVTDDVIGDVTTQPYLEADNVEENSETESREMTVSQQQQQQQHNQVLTGSALPENSSSGSSSSSGGHEVHATSADHSVTITVTAPCEQLPPATLPETDDDHATTLTDQQAAMTSPLHHLNNISSASGAAAAAAPPPPPARQVTEGVIISKSHNDQQQGRNAADDISSHSDRSEDNAASDNNRNTLPERRDCEAATVTDDPSLPTATVTDDPSLPAATVTETSSPPVATLLDDDEDIHHTVAAGLDSDEDIQRTGPRLLHGRLSNSQDMQGLWSDFSN